MLEMIKFSLSNIDSSIGVEVIIIDDFSSVAVKVVKQTAERIFLYRNLKNEGAPYSREKGFQLSQGEFIHFHDSDDSITENWLSEIINELKVNPSNDILMTGRFDVDEFGKSIRTQKYFHAQCFSLRKIKSRLVYRNCMGPLGGVTFSRRVLKKIEFKKFTSCQDWQMYIDALKYAKILKSRPDIKFIFNKMGDDRISHDPRKKILGHLQLAKITSKHSIFGRNIRLFYLYTCKHHIIKKGGSILKLYKENRLSIFVTFLVISVYWRVT